MARTKQTRRIQFDEVKRARDSDGNGNGGTPSPDPSIIENSVAVTPPTPVKKKRIRPPTVARRVHSFWTYHKRKNPSLTLDEARVQYSKMQAKKQLVRRLDFNAVDVPRVDEPLPFIDSPVVVCDPVTVPVEEGVPVTVPDSVPACGSDGIETARVAARAAILHSSSYVATTLPVPIASSDRRRSLSDEDKEWLSSLFRSICQEVVSKAFEDYYPEVRFNPID
jgi:hypothetical protein